MELIKWTQCFLLLVSIFTTAYTKDKIKDKKAKKGKALKFFRKFGYIDTFSTDINDEDLKKKVRKLQKFSSLPVTGELNEATLKQLDKERCGLSDPDPENKRKRRYTKHGSFWEKKNLRWFLNGTSNSLPRDQIREQLKKAFQLWADVIPLKFQELPFSAGADIDISFGRNYHGDPYSFDGPGGILAHAFYPTTQIGLSGDLHFDDDETYSVDENDPSKKDLLWIAVHEIGHALGLEHSTDRDAIMFAWYKGYQPDFSLGIDDVKGIQSIYKADEEPPPPPPPTLPPTPPPPPPPPPAVTTQESTTVPATTQVTTTTEASTLPATTQAATTVAKRKAPVRKNPVMYCPASVDAVFKLNKYSQYTFIISNDKMWLERNGKFVRQSLSVSAYFPKLNGNIDAAYMREDGKTVFFVGREFYIYESLAYVSGPTSISTLGLPSYVNHLSSAQMWVGNGMTYYYFKDRYWREEFDTETYGIILNGPFSLTYAWEGIPEDITATGTIEGRSLFFKDDQYYDLRISAVKAYKDYPQHLSHFFECTQSQKSSIVPKKRRKRSNQLEHLNFAKEKTYLQ